MNTFEVRPLGVVNENDCMRGLYLQAALMAHDCVGNTLLAVDEEYILTVHSTRFIKKGEPIYFNYTNSLMVSIYNIEKLRNFLTKYIVNKFRLQTVQSKSQVRIL